MTLYMGMSLSLWCPSWMPVLVNLGQVPTPHVCSFQCRRALLFLPVRAFLWLSCFEKLQTFQTAFWYRCSSSTLCCLFCGLNLDLINWQHGRMMAFMQLWVAAVPLGSQLVWRGGGSSRCTGSSIILLIRSTNTSIPLPMRIYISKIITMNNENSNELFSI